MNADVNADMNTHSNSGSVKPPQAPLCPIPRTGIQGPSGVLLYIFLFLAAATVGIGICAMRTASAASVKIAEGISIASILLLMVYLWRVTRSSKGIIPILIVVGVLLVYLTGSSISAAVLCGSIFAVSQGSLLLAVQPRKHLVWVPLVPLAAYAVAAVLSRDLFGSLAALVPFPPMLVLAWGTRNSAEKKDGLTRVGVICATALTLGLSALALIALLVYRHLGTLEPSALLDALEATRLSLIEQITSMEIPAGLNAEAVAELEEMLSYANAENMVNSVFNLLPALCVVTVTLIAAVCQLIQHAALRAFGFGESVSDRVKDFRMSLISCVVFLAAYLIAFLEGTDSSTLAGTVAQNIYIILLPGLALAGMLRIMKGLSRKGPRGMGCMFYLILLIPCLLLFAPFILAAVEVIGHIFTSITSAIKPHEDDDSFFGGPPSGDD